MRHGNGQDGIDANGFVVGSDVASLSTKAVRRNNVYVVNGAKKWITNGMWSDYCTAAVRTGGSGQSGISALVIPMKAKGVTCRKIENSGVNASGRPSSDLELGPSSGSRAS